MAATISITVRVPSVDDALYLLRLAHEEIDSNGDLSIVRVSIADDIEPPF